MNMKSQQVTKEATAKRAQAAPAVTNRVRGRGGNHTNMRKDRATFQRKADETTPRPAHIKSLEQPLQRKASKDAGASSVPPIVHEVLHSLGQPLDPATRSVSEARFGHNFSRVRVHTGGRAAESAQAVNALAYTVGDNVVFGAGHYAPRTVAGRSLLAHELGHVVQQSSQTLRSSTGRGLTANESRELEAEADRGADLAMGHQTTPMAVSSAQLALQKQKSPKKSAGLGTGTPPAFLPGISKEKVLVEQKGVQVTPNYIIKHSLSLIGNVKLSPARSVLTVSKDDLSLDFEKFGTSLKFTKGSSIKDISFSSVEVGFGPHKSQSFEFKAPSTFIWSSKLAPPDLIVGRMKMTGELRVQLMMELIPIPAKRVGHPVSAPALDPKAIKQLLKLGTIATGIGVAAEIALIVLGSIGKALIAPVIIIVPPMDDYGTGGYPPQEA